MVYETQAEAEAAIPFAEVSRNHRVYMDRGVTLNGQEGVKTWCIRRIVGDHKMPMVRRGFASEQEALHCMATDPVAIIEHEFTFPDVPWLEHIQRVGPDGNGGRRLTLDITPEQFQNTFRFRGGEFGNWNMGAEGQAALNHAWDALHDLARVLQMEPSAISLNGKLAIAFGARGHGGKDAARAHYERDYQVINLTKIRGAGSLAHEWFHALDHHLAQTSLDKTSLAMASELYRLPDHLPASLNTAFKALKDSMLTKVETRAVDTTETAAQKDRLERHVRETIARIREGFMKNHQWSRTRKTAPTPAQVTLFDMLAERIALGEDTTQIHIASEGKSSFSIGNSRTTTKAIEALNTHYKSVCGRSFHTMDENSTGRSLVVRVQEMKRTLDRCALANDGASEDVKKCTQFYDDAREIDMMRASDYWSLPLEMLARAFAAYVSDRLTAAAHRSDYLVYAAENRFYTLFGTKPYPEGGERTFINGRFDALFTEIKTNGFLH
jgi:hypothetical protein